MGGPLWAKSWPERKGPQCGSCGAAAEWFNPTWAVIWTPEGKLSLELLSVVFYCAEHIREVPEGHFAYRLGNWPGKDGSVPGGIPPHPRGFHWR